MENEMRTCKVYFAAISLFLLAGCASLKDQIIYTEGGVPPNAVRQMHQLEPAKKAQLVAELIDVVEHWQNYSRPDAQIQVNVFATASRALGELGPDAKEALPHFLAILNPRYERPNQIIKRLNEYGASDLAIENNVRAALGDVSSMIHAIERIGVDEEALKSLGLVLINPFEDYNNRVAAAEIISRHANTTTLKVALARLYRQVQGADQEKIRAAEEQLYKESTLIGQLGHPELVPGGVVMREDPAPSLIKILASANTKPR